MHPEIILIKSTIVYSSIQVKIKLLLAFGKKIVVIIIIIIIYHMVHINSRGKKDKS